MVYKVLFTKPAEKEFAALDNSIKKRIAKYIDALAIKNNPRETGKPLEENLATLWSYRVGDYRLVAEIQDDVLVILMVCIAHRKKVYKTISKRIK